MLNEIPTQRQPETGTVLQGGEDIAFHASDLPYTPSAVTETYDPVAVAQEKWLKSPIGQITTIGKNVSDLRVAKLQEQELPHQLQGDFELAA